MGASLLSKGEESLMLNDLLDKLEQIGSVNIGENKSLQPLFKD